MSIPVVWFNYINDENPRLKWDSALIDELTADSHYEHLTEIPLDGGAIVVLPGGVHSDSKYTEMLNADLAALDWVVLIVTADEQSLFPTDDVRHSNLRVWVQTPGGVYRADECFGYCNPARRRGVVSQRVSKGLDWSFLGQAGNRRRQDMLAVIADGQMPDNGEWLISDWFSGGLSADNYYRTLSRTRVVPCPSGPATPDSFRVWEAIEHGAVPLVDGACDRYAGFDYWGAVAPGASRLLVVNDWSNLAGITEVALLDWKSRSNQLWSWWFLRRRELRLKLLDTVQDLVGKV